MKLIYLTAQARIYWLGNIAAVLLILSGTCCGKRIIEEREKERAKCLRVAPTTVSRGVNFAERMKFYNWRIAIALDGQKQARKMSDRSALSSRTSTSLSCITMSYMWHTYCPGFPRPFATPRALEGSLAQSTVGRISRSKRSRVFVGITARPLSLCPSPEVIFAGGVILRATEKRELSSWEMHRPVDERASISRDTRDSRANRE